MEDQPHLLMCSPEHYGIEYEINPWMDRTRLSDRPRATSQWNRLRDELLSAGARISYLEATPGLPDLVFTANAALVSGQLAILARFRHPQRQKEEPVFRQWFSEHGYRVYELQTRADFEGAGDALFCGQTLFSGYRIRSDVAASHEIATVLGVRAVPLELVDPRFYHLDTCFCPLAPDMAAYYPAAFDRYGRQVLEARIGDLIPVAEEEAVRFACNAVVLGERVVLPCGCPRLCERLQQRGFSVREVELGEFIKAGGAAKCLTLRLDNPPV